MGSILKHFFLAIFLLRGCVSEQLQDIPPTVSAQIYSASSNAERLPADVVASVLSGSTVFGEYAEGNADFIEFHDPNGKVELRNIDKNLNNAVIDLTGSWRVRGNAICYDYSTVEYYDGNGAQFISLPESCASVFISKTGIEFLALDRSGLSVVKKIENTEFEYDFTSGFVFNEDEIKTASSSTGTGFFVSEEGVVLTNKHVVESCDSIEVVSDGVSSPATLVDISASADLAILSTEIKQTKKKCSLSFPIDV